MAEAYLVENTSSIIPYVLENAPRARAAVAAATLAGRVFCKGAQINPAVISIGMNPQCKGLDFSYRLDRPQVLARIRDPTGPTPAKPAFAVQPPRMAVRQRRHQLYDSPRTAKAGRAALAPAADPSRWLWLVLQR